MRKLLLLGWVSAWCLTWPAAATVADEAPQARWPALLEMPELKPILARFPHYTRFDELHLGLASTEAGESDDWQQGEFRRLTPEETAALRRPMPRLRQLSPDNITPRPVTQLVMRPATPPATPPAAGERARVRRGEAAPPAPSTPGDLKMAPTPQPDLDAFAAALHAALAPNVAGYALQLRRGGNEVFAVQWQWGRHPNDGSLGWTTQRRMNIASVSKFLSAVALVHALDARGISLDAPIAPWLPQYWARGPRVDQITFRQLLRHQSGFRTDSGAVDFAFMKAEVAAGPAFEPGTGGPSVSYRNLNFGLTRLLITTVGGYLDPAEVLPPGNPDALWDAFTLFGYLDYLETHLFAPAGIQGATLTKPDDAAIAYSVPVATNATGWNSGDLIGRVGSGGWHLSVEELLDLSNTLLRSGKILSPLRARQVIEAGLGLDSAEGGLGGTIGPYAWKGGSWSNTNAIGALRREQSVIVFLPQNMEIAVLVNSPIRRPGTVGGFVDVRLAELVISLFEETLVLP